ncbi:MAG: DNA polymerase III subunit alpha [Chitinophagales bacterium]
MFLNCHTYYSLRYGTMSVDRLLDEAVKYGVRRFALTDINNTSGWFELLQEAKKYNIAVHPGIEFRNDNTHLYTAIAKNADGFAEINRHLSLYLNNKEPIPEQAPAFEHCFVIYPWKKENRYKLRDNEYIGVTKNDLGALRFTPLHNKNSKLIAMRPVVYTNKKDFNAHRILRAIDKNTIITKLQPEDIAQEDACFCTADTMRDDFSDFRFALDNANKVLDACHFDFSYHTNKNIKTFTGNEKEDIDLLLQLTYDGVHARYGRLTKKIQDRINKELETVIQKGFVSYFLINRDIIRHARSRGFFTIGRGSGANSIIAYCIGITDVDPIELDLYFERFINLFRETPPDFDIDFSWKDRDEMTEYIFNKYTHEHTVLLATYTTFKDRSCIREVAKTFGLPETEIDALIANYGERIFGDTVQIPDRIARSIYSFGLYIREFPNHLGIHAGGILISEKPVYYYTATHLPPKGFPTTQFDMHVAEDIGLYKFDILSQRGLGHIREAVDLVQINRGEAVDITRVNTFKKDPLLNEKLAAGDTIGCFYIESPAMRVLLRKLICDNYLTLVAASSIIRPGVARSGMMKEFIMRHRFPEHRKNMHPVMAEIMPETYVVMVYQEDVIKVAHEFAKLTLSEADVLRRGMSGKSRSKNEFLKVKEKFFANCKELPYTESLTKDVWHQIESFAGYSFAKGHSASYAVESYQSLFLKTYYPKEFMVAVINNFGGFYSTELYVQEARRLGAIIEAPCVNRSYNTTFIYGDKVYLGFIHLSGLESKVVDALLEERNRNGHFADFSDFLARVPISLEQLEILVHINAFRFTGVDKRELLIEAYTRLNKTKKTSPSKELFAREKKLPYRFPALDIDRREDAWDEIRLLGFPLSSPFALIDDVRAEEFPLIAARDLPLYKNERVHILGYLITTKPTSTIKGERMFFGTFIDQQGDWLDTVHFPPVAKKFRFRGKGCYRITGKVVQDFETWSIEVEEMHFLKVWTPEYV